MLERQEETEKCTRVLTLCDFDVVSRNAETYFYLEDKTSVQHDFRSDL